MLKLTISYYSTKWDKYIVVLDARITRAIRNRIAKELGMIGGSQVQRFYRYEFLNGRDEIKTFYFNKPINELCKIQFAP